MIEWTSSLEEVREVEQTLEQRVSSLEKEIAELNGQLSERPKRFVIECKVELNIEKLAQELEKIRLSGLRKLSNKGI